MLKTNNTRRVSDNSVQSVIIINVLNELDCLLFSIPINADVLGLSRWQSRLIGEIYKYTQCQRRFEVIIVFKNKFVHWCGLHVENNNNYDFTPYEQYVPS